MLTRAFRRFWNSVTLTPLRRVATAALAIVLAGAGVVGAVTATRLADSCGQPGVFHRGSSHECTGVTDGHFDFESQLTGVDQAIVRENQAVAHKNYATVALLLPMTDPSAAMKAEILHEVQGAYAAQHQANLPDSPRPYIRLVLANPGYGSAGFLPVVRQLAAMTGAPDNLRAVVGISVSTDATKAEVQWLTSHHIPVAGGAITADNLANATDGRQSYPGLVRVEPTNTQEADALIGYAQQHQANRKQSAIVEDTRTDDDYITTLKTAFAKALGSLPEQDWPYQSPADVSQDGTTANRFAAMAGDICGAGPKWIYFAGRQVQLRQFINQLYANCPARHFTIFTGDAGSHLATDPELSVHALTSTITLDFAAIATPDAWTQVPPPATGGSKADYDTFLSGLQAVGAAIGNALDDGQAIINYDATMTAVAGIRKAASTATGKSTLSDVADAWLALHGPSLVKGASGWICLDNSGNPWDKAVPIEHLAGRSPQFVQLAWPSGNKPPASTGACRAPGTG